MLTPEITDDQIRELAEKFATDALLLAYCEAALQHPRDAHDVKGARRSLAWLRFDLGMVQ